MFTGFENDEVVFESLCNGAVGYLLKNTHPARLLDAVRDAMDGGAPMSPAVARKVVQTFREGQFAARRAPWHSLTPQEVRLLALLGEGHSYASAAADMDLSINTVRNYIRSIYDKLHVHTKSAAVSKALKNGIL
jgi:DNA-binding NarL/FixJ family response regulator